MEKGLQGLEQWTNKSTCFAWGREQELGGEEIPFCAAGFLAGRAGKSLIRNYQKSPFKSRISIFKIDSGFSFPIQDFISEHYGEEGTLFEKEIKEFMELRQVGGPGHAESCFGLLRNARWRCRALLWVPSCFFPNCTLVLASRGCWKPAACTEHPGFGS